MPATFAIIGFDAEGRGSFIAGPEVSYKEQVALWNEIRMGKPMEAAKVEKWSSDMGKLAEFYPKNKPTRKPSKKTEND